MIESDVAIHKRCHGIEDRAACFGAVDGYSSSVEAAADRRCGMAASLAPRDVVAKTMKSSAVAGGMTFALRVAELKTEYLSSRMC